VIVLDATGACSAARLGVTGASSVPGHGASVERGLAGKKLDDESIRKAADTIAGDIEFESHRICTAQDREELCKVLTRRAVTKAEQRARSGPTAR
jgi:carbon-monoxide dehydrogenase medium subunit